MMCWVLGLFWRGFIGWQMLARVQDWWLVDVLFRIRTRTCTRLLQLEDCSVAVYELRGEVYTQHMFSRASYRSRSRLEIKELHLPGAYPAREPECVNVWKLFFTCERLRSYVLMCVCELKTGPHSTAARVKRAHLGLNVCLCEL